MVIKNYLSWNWTNAFLVFICSIPAVYVAIVTNLAAGLGLLIGLIPAAVMTLPAKRKKRVSILILGIAIGLSVFIGSALKVYFGVIGATLALGLFAYLSTVFAASKKGNPAIMFFIIPVVGIGLSITTIDAGISMMINMMSGAALAFVVSLFFPAREPVEKTAKGAPNKAAFKNFAPYYTTAIMVATVIGFYLDHTGWIVGSVGLVMRPLRDMQEMRSIFRVISVFIGVTLVYFVMISGASDIALVGTAVLMLVLASGLHESKIYIMPLFITYIVFTFMLVADGQRHATHWWLLSERLLWVASGVVIAYIFGLLLPKAFQKNRND
ncbi:FUSC family protein [Listeria fleischmannii]|uniref:Integral membrane bound transporter domain-containing protein n=1 Tax=Listeria fleischmannii TaxID=1069827 RepID=A0A841YFA6_9LIST|nr:FUSC family protein [Listeria fleischmannii]MBC1399065.1 hypothetical protein [Listeria fleischmannii]MBC1427318.1 hypothetical protein [Listeria fleischmannii]STY34586.1 Uncharacterised protein [Listeria fleischmannii subsp. coloradonensis]